MENKEITPYEFLSSNEFYEILEKIEEVLNIDFINERDKSLSLTFLIDYYFRNNISVEEFKELLNQEPKILNEEEINFLIDFINQNLEPIKIKLFKNLGISTKPKPTFQPVIQTFEEKARKYEEIMSAAIKPPITKEKTEIKTETEIQKENTEKTTLQQENIEVKKENISTFQEEKKQENILIEEDKKVEEILKPQIDLSQQIDLSEISKNKQEEKEIQQSQEQKVIDQKEKNSFKTPDSQIIILKKTKKQEESENVLDLSNL
jgi:hypothetical protein